MKALTKFGQDSLITVLDWLISYDPHCV